ncbi:MULTISPECIES: LPS export ABC transporter periplasmic protein LptC [unclassified Mesorhizobium]|uniref:LPS export ABC transporter periplasmic protein LptC n=1 Tax=unclassified Mesorhizobium TaxID=325217 RepID=UPI000F752AF6|nr:MULTISPECIES: LPS export ABC transporter periplasmic protein LptC [unclassified Mesorhizobium]AZO03213.1 LPS export ABC transporter periplasmic protein LptC [Mesorhizobium sp. M2A.F.Ca.ET.043.02.1.1]RUW42941.1 LPS export ABC transporter periplasmic protein LptC [Mesorhizobium sp. M2A.F.Ca.ET.015.02.1.1]RUW74700.1 LPS export ABC transporter periplasmic protein LptC [Mesorhizobium sp. M2A.F.Ca.ET.067.02.1.1]RVC96709.1 LPS export ABC transporter periplasmic protein LptC [Mesorhizobium sp. M2A.F
MLARSDETSDAAAAPAPAIQEGTRGEAFNRAQRHSRRVRVLKFAVPLLAAAIAIAFPVYSYLKAPVSISVQADGTAFSNGKLVMANPKLNGFTKQKLPYSLTASRATQDVGQQAVIDLEGINAKLPVATDNIVSVDAEHGIYNRDANTMDLTSDVSVTTTDGLAAKFKSIFLDMGKGSMKTSNPVDVSRGGSRITADSMSVEDNGRLVVFENRVRVNIDPTALKAAGVNSGEQNASQ